MNTYSIVVGVEDAESVRVGGLDLEYPQLIVGYEVSVILKNEAVCDAILSAVAVAKEKLAGHVVAVRSA